MIDPRTITAREIASAVNIGKLSPRDVIEAYLERIASVDPVVSAFAFIDREALRRQADHPASGPLAGVPFGIKDVFDTADMPTAYGTDIYEGFRPARDASAVHLARRAGAVAMGKTVTTEFATAAPGATRNPFNPDHTPGGSSSGSAAGLAAGFFPLAFGTQTSGSTIRPSSYCGVIGYKPGRGLIDRTGVKPLAENLDVVGLMARNVRDCALFASVVARRPDFRPSAETTSLPRIGLFAPEHPDIPSSVSRSILENAARHLGRVETRPAPGWWDGLGPAQADVFAWEASAALAPEHDLHGHLLKPLTHAFFARHEGVDFNRWLVGIAARDHALSDLDTLFGDCNLLITQAAPGEAPAGLETTGPAAYNTRWTLLGTPSITVPAGLGLTGLPIGIQIVARPGEDAALLHHAARIEDALRGAGIPARPDISGL